MFWLEYFYWSGVVCNAVMAVWMVVVGLILLRNWKDERAFREEIVTKKRSKKL